MAESIKYNCVFGGGGIRGMCYVGALKALKEFNIELESIAGSSVGAVFAAFLACGYNEDEIRNIFFDFNINIFRDINIGFFTPDISISKGEIFLDWLREKIGQKFFGKSYSKSSDFKVRFKDLNIPLYILTVDLNTNTPFIFSKENTPDEEVAFAVRASASLPGLMRPVNYNSNVLVDGDLIKSWPAWRIYDSLNNSNSRILEFRLEGSRDGSDIKNPADYLNSVINTIWSLSTENVFNTYNDNDRYDFVVIDSKDLILFDFTIDKSVKEQLADKGYISTKNYLSKTLVYKKKKIISSYKYLQLKIKLLKKLLASNKAGDVIFVLNEILAQMCELNKYTDIAFYELLKDFKDFILQNLKKKFLFQDKILNNKTAAEKLDFIERLTEERINEISEYITKFGNNC